MADAPPSPLRCSSKVARGSRADRVPAPQARDLVAHDVGVQGQDRPGVGHVDEHLAARSGNLDAVKAQWLKVAEACGACHGGPAKSGGKFRFEEP